VSYRNLIFLHIPKAAGTTLHSILEARYAPSSCHSIYDPDGAAKEFAQWPRARREPIRLLKGHVAFGLHKSLIGVTTYITMLRDPVDRIMSHYYYVKRMPGHYLYKQVTERNMSLAEYASSMLTDELDNGQVRLLAGAATGKSVPLGECNTQLLNVAKNNIERHFAVAGLAEAFDASLALMAIRLGWDWTPAYESLNVSPQRPAKGQIDAAAREHIEKSNPLDCELYAWARLRFAALLGQHRDAVGEWVSRIHAAKGRHMATGGNDRLRAS
jgi:hypothetical protein